MTRTNILFIMILLLLFTGFCRERSDGNPPPAPDDITLLPPSTSLEYVLYWTEVEYADSYNVYFCCSSGNVHRHELMKINVAEIYDTSYLFQLPLECNFELSNGIFYLFAVSAVNKFGESEKKYIELIKISMFLFA